MRNDALHCLLHIEVTLDYNALSFSLLFVPKNSSFNHTNFCWTWNLLENTSLPCSGALCFYCSSSQMLFLVFLQLHLLLVSPPHRVCKGDLIRCSASSIWFPVESSCASWGGFTH